MPNLVEREVEVERWFVPGEFNPASPDQIRAYMEHTGVKGKPGKKSKTGKPSTDENTLKRLASKDEFYGKLLDFRKVEKLRGTYVASNLGRLDEDSRVHPKFLHNPSTWRLSSVDPNWQNIPIRDIEEEDGIARGFRKTVVASPGCMLVEADFSSIEAVETGWFCDDPDYIRLARYGIHSYLTSHMVKDPADLSWPEDKLAAHLAGIKKQHKDGITYYAMKRTVHLTNYGGSPHMMQRVEPSIFPTIKSAFESQQFYLNLVPKLKAWQSSLRQRAARENCLGGNDHPFGLKHWFWDVVSYDKNGRQQPGTDWNRVVAFYPQSASACVLYEAVLRLTDPDSPYYVGDMYYGDTPLRALIHDSIVGEVPTENLAEFLVRLRGSMLEPVRAQPLTPAMQERLPDMGPFLRIAVDVKTGPNWADMEAA
jgi:hypothetical protein